MTDYEFIRYEQRDHVATVILNRPEVLNAIHPPMAEELADAWERIRDDDSVWVGVLTGSGDRAFCAGADLKWRVEAGEDARSHNRAEASGAARGFQRGRDCYKPLLAVVNGYAVGGGLELGLRVRFGGGGRARAIGVARGAARVAGRRRGHPQADSGGCRGARPCSSY